nr:putative ribonuclease H-like domain-containing protein [Tanacetum cinerariifolium]
MNVNCLTVDACEQCFTTESELKIDFIKKENYEMLLKQYNTLEKHCISLELNNQLNTKIFQRDNYVSSSESAPTFAELFKTNELKAQIQEKDTVILKLKEKIKNLRADDKESKVEDIETQNLKLDHRVTKLTAENNHLKQTYKQLFDSIKSSRVQSKEQSCAMAKSTKKSHKPKSEDTNQENLYLLHMDLCVPMLVESVNGKKNDWDLLFQPLFDELLNPPPSVDNQDAEDVGNSTGSPSSTAVDQDAPSPSKSLTPTEIQS